MREPVSQMLCLDPVDLSTVQVLCKIYEPPQGIMGVLYIKIITQHTIYVVQVILPIREC